jgi:flagellar motor component MotA
LKEFEMKKSSYLIYLVLSLTSIAALIFFTGASYLFYIDIASLLVILIFLCILTIFQTGVKRTLDYYKCVFDPRADKALVTEAAGYFSSLSLYTLAVGSVVFFTGLIAVLGNLEDTSSVGPNLALALITLLYAGLLCVLIFLPFRIALEKRMD